MSSPARILRRQFRDPQQQRDTATMGMFTFMATEVMFFGGLFMAYSVYRMYYTAGFLEASREMTLLIGSINTAVLFTSCLIMSLAIHAITIGKQIRCYWLLILTAVIGLLFVALKFLEYFIHYSEHKVPGIWFTSHSPHAHAVQLFFFSYFALTGRAAAGRHGAEGEVPQGRHSRRACWRRQGFWASLPWRVLSRHASSL